MKYYKVHEGYHINSKIKPISNKSIWTTVSIIAEVFTVQYCGQKSDEIDEEYGFKRKDILPTISPYCLDQIVPKYPNNIDSSKVFDGYLEKFDSDDDKFGEQIVKMSRLKDDRKIIKHEPLPEKESKDEPKQDKKVHLNIKHDLTIVDKCFKEWMNDNSVHKAMTKSYNLPTKDNLLQNRYIMAPLLLAVHVFNIQYSSAKDYKSDAESFVKKSILDAMGEKLKGIEKYFANNKKAAGIMAAVGLVVGLALAHFLAPKKKEGINELA